MASITRPRRVVIATILLLVVGACTSGTTSAPERHSDRPVPAYGRGWSAIHADAANSDYSVGVAPSQVTSAWQRSFDGEVRVAGQEWTINVGPTISPDGLVYLTTTVRGCHLQVLDLRTGSTRWCAPEVENAAVVSSALLDREGHAFLADGRFMRAFDRDGHELWRTPIVGQPLSAQFSPRGRVLFVTHVGVVYLLDRRTGRPVIAPMELVPGATWEPAQGMWACARGTAACPSANTIAVDERTGRFFFTFWAPGAESAGIRAMEVDERGTTRIRTLWSNDDLPGGSGSSPDLSPDGSRLYVTDNVDSLHTIDARTGKEVWKLRIGVAPAGSLSSSPDGLLIPTGGPLQAIRDTGSAGVVAWRDESLLSRGIATQARGHRAYATIAAAGGGNDLVVVDTRTGRELDREPMPGATRFSVGTTMALDGTVLVPTIAGDLFAFRAAR